MLENSPKTVKCVINFETDCGYFKVFEEQSHILVRRYLYN